MKEIYIRHKTPHFRSVAIHVRYTISCLIGSNEMNYEFSVNMDL